MMAQAPQRKPTESQGRPPGEKSAAAFRTISEVASELDLPQHVLRFWESKFPNVRPLKRGGGRRYYRPEDVRLLRRIRDLLYTEGYTIRGVQKLLRQNGAKALVTSGDTGDTVDTGDTTAPAAEAAPAGLDAHQRAELRAILTELEEIRDLLGKSRP